MVGETLVWKPEFRLCLALPFEIRLVQELSQVWGLSPQVSALRAAEGQEVAAVSTGSSGGAL